MDLPISYCQCGDKAKEPKEYSHLVVSYMLPVRRSPEYLEALNFHGNGKVNMLSGSIFLFDSILSKQPNNMNCFSMAYFYFLILLLLFR